MPGLVPGIHVLASEQRTWMAGTSPAMTTEQIALRRVRDTSACTRHAYRAQVLQKRLPSKDRGRRERRVRYAPAALCAMKEGTQAKSPQVRRHHTGIPRAMVLRLISCSPRGPGFVAPVAREASPHVLDTCLGVSGPHNFAVRHHRRSSRDNIASIASRSTFRDDWP
jgi:hypothetical protein